MCSDFKNEFKEARAAITELFGEVRDSDPNDDMQQQMAKVAIPGDLNFTDLRLARDPDGSVSFDWE